MHVLHSGDAVPAALRSATVAIGNFDGVHLGHAALLARAKAQGAPFGALTFEPHPSKVLNAALAPRLILTAAEKERELRKHELDVLAVVRFDHALAQLPPGQFVDDILVRWLGVRGVVVGEGFRFGHKAAGTVGDLRARLPVEEVPSVRVGGLVVSSTKIRELVLEGRVDAAALLLGRPYSVEGPVVRGDGRGRTIGIPTANVQVERELLPKVGVYATRAVLDDGRVKGGVTNVGLRPTFQGEGVRIEAHLFDVNEDLYGKPLKLELVKHLREEQRFSGVDALVAQIHRDIDAAKAALA